MKKDIIIYEEGFFSKIRRFFLRLFKNKNTNEIKENFQNQSNIEKNDFMKKIEIRTPQTNTISLKYKLRNGEIAISDLSDSELDDIIDYYEVSTKEKMKKLQIKNAG